MHPATTLKVLQISPEYPPYHVGGGGIVVQSIAQKLSKRGHCVSVIAGYYPTKHGFERTKVIKDGQVDVYLLPLVPTPRLPFQLKTVMPPNILSLFNLTKILLRQKFDIIHLHGFGHFIIDISAFICRMTGRQYVVTLHGFPHSPYKAGRIFRFLYRLYSVVLGSLTLLKATHITAVSSAVRTEAEFYGINEVEIIPNGIDLDQFYEIQPISDIRASLGVQQDDLLIVAIGILHERKGFQYLI
jgi:glycosyltransferase involved in cell wall biosynthesis